MRNRVFVSARRLLAAAAIASMAAGCSGAHQSGATANAANDSRPSARPEGTSGTWLWRRTDLHAVTQPVAAAGHFLVYAEQYGQLSVLALDPHTGKTVWGDGVTSSEVAPGVHPQITVSGTTVVFPRGGSGDDAEIVAVNGADGTLLWHTPPGRFTTWPSVCADDAKAICLTGVFGSGYDEPRSPMRLAIASGRRLAVPAIPAVAMGREVGTNLFDTGQRNPETLVETAGTHVRWERDLSSIFTSPAASTDDGWDFDRLPKLGLYVGWVGSAPVRRTRTSWLRDMSHNMVAAFRIADGKPVWRTPHAYYDCGNLPCPGEDGPSQTPTIGVREIVTGHSSGRYADTGSVKFSADTHDVMQGFDLRTGRTLWSFDAGRAPDLLSDNVIPARAGTASIVVRDKTGTPVVLDLATGGHTPVTADSPVWCRPQVTYHPSAGYETNDGRTITTFEGDYALQPCDAQGRAMPLPARIPAFLGAIGGRLDATIAWTAPDGVYAGTAA